MFSTVHCFPQEIFTTDAAADELKVARILGGHSEEPAYFENLSVRLRDRCHAAARQSHACLVVI